MTVPGKDEAARELRAFVHRCDYTTGRKHLGQLDALLARVEALETIANLAEAFLVHEADEPSGPGGSWPDWIAAHRALRENLVRALAAHSPGSEER